MNRKLYGDCAEIPDVERKRDRGAFFKSIYGTLNHLLYGDRVWMGRFTDKLFLIAIITQELYTDFDELRREREHMDQAILDWAIGLSQDWLERSFEYTSNIDQKTRILPTWVLVVHMFNHQTHHSGQLTTLFSQMGVTQALRICPGFPALIKWDSW